MDKVFLSFAHPVLQLIGFCSVVKGDKKTLILIVSAQTFGFVFEKDMQVPVALH